MKVNRKLNKLIRFLREIYFYFWLIYTFIKHSPEIIYLFIVRELLYIRVYIIYLIEFLFRE
jgi:hypothetical protein